MHKAGKSEKGFGFDVDNTIGRYVSPIVRSNWHQDRVYIVLFAQSTLPLSFSTYGFFMSKFKNVIVAALPR